MDALRSVILPVAVLVLAAAALMAICGTGIAFN